MTKEPCRATRTWGVAIVTRRLALAVLVCSSAVLAQDKLDQRVEFEIPAQPLDAALLEFSDQADVQVLVAAEAVSESGTEGFSGRASARFVLATLLAGTGLSFQSAGDTVTITSAEEAPAREAPAEPPLSLAQARNQTSNQSNQTDIASGTERKDEESVLPLGVIAITGSHIRGPGPAGSHVFTYYRDEIEREGYSTLPEFIQSIPQNYSGGITESTSQFGGAANGALQNFNEGSGVNLRGLGNVSTLVLLDGQRLSPTGRNGSFVDISMIPLSAIDRMEVLADGASAIYGSDAIGGVVNIVTRRDYAGAETRLRYGAATGGGLEETMVGQTFGKTWSEGHGLISYEYHSRKALNAADRSFSQNAVAPNELLPEQERHSLFLTGGQNLTGLFEVFTTAYFSKRDSERFLSSPPVVPTSLATADSEQYGASLGGAFDFDSSSTGNGWRAELIGSYSRNKSISDTLNLSTGSHQLLGRGSENLSVDLTLNGSIFSMPGGDAKLAVGAQYRRDQFFNVPVAGGGSGILPLPEDFNRNVKAGFAELYLPLVGKENRKRGIERLALSLSARREDYSDFGSTTDPKLGVKWSPADGLYLRGTYGTSFRAPLFTELDEAGNVTFLVNGIPNPSSGTSLVVMLLGEGNRNMQPETATLWTTGLDFQPVAAPNFNINATYFDIEYEDRIALPPFTTFSTLLTDPVLASLVDLDGIDAETQALIDQYQQINLTFVPDFGPPADYADAEVVFDGRTTNLASTHTTGLDFLVSYALNTNQPGSWKFSLNGTYLFDFTKKVTDAAPSFEAVDTIQNPVDLRWKGGVSWTYEGFVASLFVNHVDDYRNNVSAQDSEVDSWTTANLTLSYMPRYRSSGGWLNDTVVTLSATNLLDEDPPFVESLRTQSGVNYDPNAASPAGRVLSLQVSKTW